MNLDFEAKFRLAIKKIGEVGELYATARGQSYQLQEMKSAIVASLMQALPDMPISKAEMTAKASTSYMQHIDETAKAITKELKLKADYEKWKATFEALRSMCSLEKITQKEIGQ